MTKIPYTLGIKSRSSRLPLSENTTYPRASRTNARTGTMGCVSYISWTVTSACASSTVVVSGVGHIPVGMLGD